MVECAATAWKPDLGVRYHALTFAPVTNIDAGSVVEIMHIDGVGYGSCCDPPMTLTCVRDIRDAEGD